MSRVVNAIVIGIAAFILLAGSIWYVSVANGRDRLAVNAQTALESADTNTTRVRAEVEFENRYDVEVRLAAFEYRFKVNDLDLASHKNASANTSSDADLLKPKEKRVERFVMEFPTDLVANWLQDHVANGEKSTVSFSGTATFMVGTRNQTVDFNDERSFSTKIQGGVEDVKNCPTPSPEPCIDLVEGAWRERQNTKVLELDVRLKNTADAEVKVDHPGAELRFGNVTVSKTEAGGAILPKGGAETIRFPLFLEHESIKKWWPDHAQACEASPIALAIHFTYQTSPSDQNTTSPTPTSINLTTSSAPPTTTETTPTTSASPTTATTTPTSEPPPPTTSSAPPPSSSTPTTSAPPPSSSTAPTTSSTSTVTITYDAARAAAPASIPAPPPANVPTTTDVTYLFILPAQSAPTNATSEHSFEAGSLDSQLVCEKDSDGLKVPGF